MRLAQQASCFTWPLVSLHASVGSLGLERPVQGPGRKDRVRSYPSQDVTVYYALVLVSTGSRLRDGTFSDRSTAQGANRVSLSTSEPNARARSCVPICFSIASAAAPPRYCDTN
jgi:hypothetical protein